jgi:hypothetical protein
VPDLLIVKSEGRKGRERDVRKRARRVRGQLESSFPRLRSDKRAWKECKERSGTYARPPVRVRKEVQPKQPFERTRNGEIGEAECEGLQRRREECYDGA